MMNMKTLCLLVVLAMTETVLCADKKEDKIDKTCRSDEPCPVAFTTLGCYTDSKGDRVLPYYIYNERDPTASNYGNRNIDWYNWEKYITGFACRCAKVARAKGYDLFGVQFYGECWAGHSNTHDYKRLGSSAKCVGDYYKSCESLDRYCSGKQETNFVYKIMNSQSCSLQFEEIGCYRDNHAAGARPLGNYVLNDRDSTATASYSGQLIDWASYDVYLPDLACRCAMKAQESGSTYFGLQYYGECWTHPEGDRTYSRDGTHGSSCINNCYKKCIGRSGEICTGEQYSNYVYRIKVAGAPTCDVTIESIGCYKEKPSDRALNTELVNTKPGTELFYGELPIIKGQWQAFFQKFLCKCAHEAKTKGWAYFGVTDFGACYSDVASENYNKYGVSSSCGEGFSNNTCAAGSMLCGGADTQTNYVYKITLPSSSSKRSFIPAKKPFKRMSKDLDLEF